MDRKKLEALAWKHTHRDYRTIGTDHRQWIQVSGGLVDVTKATDAQLVAQIPTGFRPRVTA